ncbi:unnamed protein product, partial [Phaeothamnion confervicola]
MFGDDPALGRLLRGCSRLQTLRLCNHSQLTLRRGLEGVSLPCLAEFDLWGCPAVDLAALADLAAATCCPMLTRVRLAAAASFSELTVSGRGGARGGKAERPKLTSAAGGGAAASERVRTALKALASRTRYAQMSPDGGGLEPVPHWRHYHAVLAFGRRRRRERRAAATIWRAWEDHERRRASRLQNSARSIVDFLRRTCCPSGEKKTLLRKRAAVRVLQALARARHTRRRFEAAASVQALWRGRSTRRVMTRVLVFWHAAVVIQCSYRGHAVRRDLRILDKVHTLLRARQALGPGCFAPAVRYGHDGGAGEWSLAAARAQVTAAVAALRAELAEAHAVATRQRKKRDERRLG